MKILYIVRVFFREVDLNVQLIFSKSEYSVGFTVPLRVWKDNRMVL